MSAIFLRRVFHPFKAASKAGADKQKKDSSSKIVIEHVSFPDALKRYDVYPWETINIDDFKKAYTEMLTSKNHENGCAL